MRTSLPRDLTALIAGMLVCHVTTTAASAMHTWSYFDIYDGFGRMFLDIKYHTFSDVFFALAILLGGLITGLIAGRRGFVLGFSAFALINLFIYIRGGLHYHPLFAQWQWINGELATLLGWGAQSGVAGIAGATLVNRWSLTRKQTT